MTRCIKKTTACNWKHKKVKDSLFICSILNKPKFSQDCKQRAQMKCMILLNIDVGYRFGRGFPNRGCSKLLQVMNSWNFWCLKEIISFLM